MLRSIVLLAAVSASAYSGGFPAETPTGLSGSAWESIRTEYQRHRQAVIPEAGGHRARNYGQQWMTRFDGSGFDITPDAGGWRWGLELRSYGFPGQEHVVKQARPNAEVEKLTYRWDPLMTEWFVNGSRGLEHGFTLASRPGRGDSALALHLAVRGTLTARVSPNGRAVSFLDARGAPALTYAGLKVTDAQGRELAAQFAREPDGLRLEVEERDAHYPITIDPVVQQAYLKPDAVGPAGQVGNNFGWSVSVSGEVVVVGAPYEGSDTLGVIMTPIPNNGPPPMLTNAAVKAGAAYVFVVNNGVWTQQAYLKPDRALPGKQDGHDFGWSVAISKDTVVVGAPGESSDTTGINNAPTGRGATNSGAAYVFVFHAGAWVQEAYIKPAKTQDSAQFGTSVAVDGELVVVGAPGESSSDLLGATGPTNLAASGAGAAYVFGRSRSGVWTQAAYLKPAAIGTTQANDRFGTAVAISGSTVVVVAFAEDSSSGPNVPPNELAGDSGAAYVFAEDLTTGKWNQQAYLKPLGGGILQAGDNFGKSVAISGDTVVVGAPSEDSSTLLGSTSPPNELAFGAGAVYVFTRSGVTWSQQAYLKPATLGAAQTQNNNNFGQSVAISGDTVVVGAPGENSSSLLGDPPGGSALRSGAAYVFARSGATWNQLWFMKPASVGTTVGSTQAGDNFGWSVGVSGSLVVAGAPLEDSSTLHVNSTPNETSANSGAAYILSMPVPVTITVDTSPTGLLFSVSGAGCAPGSNYVAPHSLTWTSGSSCTLSVNTPQSFQKFTQWEDGSTNPVRPIVAPSFNSAFTATFTSVPLGTLPFHVDAILNGASFAVGQAVAPGSLVSIFGGGFTTIAAGVSAATAVLPVSLDSVSVSFNGVSAPLTSVFPGQINAQVPWSTTNPAAVTVRVNGVSGFPVTVQIAPVAGGVFAAGTWAVAVNPDGTLAWLPGTIPGLITHAALPGDIIVLYATGLGAVSPSIADGVPSSDALRNAAKPQVLIGGVAAQVQFAGLTPQFTGVNQLNVVVPQVAAGVQPVQISSGGIVSTVQTTLVVGK